MFLLLNMFHCISKLKIFIRDKVLMLMTKADEKWQNCFNEYFLFEIFLGADTI